MNSPSVDELSRLRDWFRLRALNHFQTKHTLRGAHPRDLGVESQSTTVIEKEKGLLETLFGSDDDEDAEDDEDEDEDEDEDDE